MESNVSLFYWFDHYHLLGVAQTASSVEIDDAYAAALKSISPNWWVRTISGLRGKSRRRFQSAHEELMDPVKRVNYDAYLVRVANAFPILIA
jgi:DnaJ-class molecular chaperone